MELLIVVAIIAVLVAIAIPLFTAQLEKSRESVDIANSRSAIAVAAAGYMDGTLEPGVTYYYDLNGFSTTKPDAYGRGTESDGGTVYPDNEYGMAYDPAADYTQSVIVATMEAGATYPVVKWDRVGISVSAATSAAQIMRGLNISNFWSETNGREGWHPEDATRRDQINSALAAAGYDTGNLTYQRDNADINGIYVTLDGRLTTDMIGQTVRVVRYDVKTGVATEGTMTVVGSGAMWSRASVGIRDFQAD